MTVWVFGILVHDVEGIQEFGVHAESELLAVEGGRGIDGAHVYLVLAVLHVHEGDVTAIEELGVATVGTADGTIDFFFEGVMFFIIAGNTATITLAYFEQGYFLHLGLEIYTEIGVFFHTIFDL